MLPRHIIYKCILLRISMTYTSVNSLANHYRPRTTNNFTVIPIKIHETTPFNSDKINIKLVRPMTKNKEYSLNEFSNPRSKIKRKNYSYENGLFDFEGAFYDDSDYDSASAYDNKPSVVKKTKYNLTNDKLADFEVKENSFRQKHIYLRGSHSSEKEDEESTNGLEGFYHTVYDPVQSLVKSILKDPADQNSEEQNNNNDHSHPDQFSEKPSLFDGLFDSWFGFNRQTKMLSTTSKPISEAADDQESSHWFNSWFGVTEEKDNFNNWFNNWFGSLPEPEHNKTTMSTVVLPQLPFVSILDPQTNSQNLIGILSNHFVNLNSTIPFITKTPNVKNKLQGPLSYNKYQIWHLRPVTQTQVRVLEKYKQNDFNKKINWLKGPSLRGGTDILISPTMFEDFENFLISESISYEIKVFDVGKVINYEKKRDRHSVKNLALLKLQSVQTMPWDKYYNYDSILKYLESVHLRYSKNVELIHIGRSFEGRPLIIVKISSEDPLKNTLNGINFKTLKMKKTWEEKNSIFIEAGTHGMEWIGPAAATWIINEILQVMKKKNTTNIEQQHIRNTTWYIMPVLNPDGYVYSHDNDRFWRKTRSRQETEDGFFKKAITWFQQKQKSSKYCFGVDLDKNWIYHWGEQSSSSYQPCHTLYAGNHPLSEPETKALSQFIMEHRKNIKLFVSLQAYGQIVKYPYKENASTLTADAMEDILDVANQGVNGLRKSGSKTRYRVDFFNDLIEKRSGSSDSFALYKASIPFAYTIYLADNGVHGILLPSSLIEKTSRDAFKIIISMYSYIYEL